MAWDDDYPYAFQLSPEDIQPSGLNIELAMAVLAESNCQLRFLKMPWARALVELSQGRIDIIGGAYPNQERQQYARYSKINFYFENVLFIRTDISNNVALHTLSDIQKNQLKVGVQIDVYYGEAFDTLKLSPDFSRLIYPNTSRKALWGMLGLGRLDGVIADARSGQEEVKKLNLSSIIVPSNLVITNQASHFIFSKKSVKQEFVENFDKTLNKLKANGLVKAILEKYSPKTNQ